MPETYYIAYNRAFNTRAEAEAWCIACDLNPEYIKEVNTVDSLGNNAL